MRSMKEQYGGEKGESVFYASRNKGVIKGVEKKKKAHGGGGGKAGGANFDWKTYYKAKAKGYSPKEIREAMGNKRFKQSRKRRKLVKARKALKTGVGLYKKLKKMTSKGREK